MSDLSPDESVCGPATVAAIKTLSAIEHVLRLYWSPDRFVTNTNSLEWLLDNGLIAPTEGQWWFVTDRGKAYCEGIRNVPLPTLITEWRIL